MQTISNIQDQFRELQELEGALQAHVIDGVVYITHKTGVVRQADIRPAAQAIKTGAFRVATNEEIATYEKAQEEEARFLMARHEARQKGRMLPPRIKKGEK